MTHFQPEGAPALSPYLVLEGASRFIAFAQSVLGATEVFAMRDEHDAIHHAELQFGDARIMCADTTDQHKLRTAMLHLYVPDVDATYRAALAAGAVSTREPADQFYGDRNAGVKDPWGNDWYLATHLEDLTEEEMAERAQAAMSE